MEARKSPDDQSIAIRTEAPLDAWNAWGTFHRRHGGGWAYNGDVADWIPIPDE